MNRVSGIKDFFRDCGRQIIETLILVFCAIAPLVFNASDMFLPYLAESKLEPDNVVGYLTVKNGNWTISIVLVLIVLWRIRAHNKEQIMNTTEIYHDYPYWLYWYCAKILGYGKCDLVLVPINMQFKLVIRGTFSEYPMIDDDYPPIEDEECTVTITNENNKTTELNIILEDTYSINSIPANKRALKTIRITRQGLDNASRHFCESFVEATMKGIRSQAERITVNVFATTNPKNSLHIAKRVFKAASRANVSHLYVFQQNKNKATDRWYFEESGHKIY